MTTLLEKICGSLYRVKDQNELIQQCIEDPKNKSLDSETLKQISEKCTEKWPLSDARACASDLGLNIGMENKTSEPVPDQSESLSPSIKSREEKAYLGRHLSIAVGASYRFGSQTISTPPDLSGRELPPEAREAYEALIGPKIEESNLPTILGVVSLGYQPDWASPYGFALLGDFQFGEDYLDRNLMVGGIGVGWYSRDVGGWGAPPASFNVQAYFPPLRYHQGELEFNPVEMPRIGFCLAIHETVGAQVCAGYDLASSVVHEHTKTDGVKTVYDISSWLLTIQLLAEVKRQQEE